MKFHVKIAVQNTKTTMLTNSEQSNIYYDLSVLIKLYHIITFKTHIQTHLILILQLIDNIPISIKNKLKPHLTWNYKRQIYT